MARKAQKPALPNREEAYLKTILDGIEKLWSENGEKAMAFCDESQAKKITVTFKTEIDESQSSPGVVVHVRFSESVTQSVKYTIDDPNQMKFTQIESSDNE